MKGGNYIFILILPVISISILVWSLYQTVEKNRELERMDRDLSIYKISAYLNKYTFIDEASNALDSVLVKKVEESKRESVAEPLLEFLNDKPTLVYRVSDSHCDNCVEATLNVLTNKISVMPEIMDQTIILGSYQTDRSLYAWKVYNEIEFETYNVNKKNLLLKSDEASKPYLFVLLPNNTVTCLFVPSEYKPELTVAYLDIVFDKFFNRKRSSVYN